MLDLVEFKSQHLINLFFSFHRMIQHSKNPISGKWLSTQIKNTYLIFQWKLCHFLQLHMIIMTLSSLVPPSFHPANTFSLVAPWSWDTTNISAYQSELPAGPLQFNPARSLHKTLLVKFSTSSLQVSSHVFLIKDTGIAHSELRTIASNLNLQHIIIICLSIYHLGTFFHHLKSFILEKELLGEGPFVAGGSGSAPSLCHSFSLSAPMTDTTSLPQNLCENSLMSEVGSCYRTVDIFKLILGFLNAGIHEIHFSHWKRSLQSASFYFYCKFKLLPTSNS